MIHQLEAENQYLKKVEKRMAAMEKMMVTLTKQATIDNALEAAKEK